MINGEEISQEEYDNLASMNEYAATLKNTLSEIETKIYNGEVRISQSRTRQRGTVADAADSNVLDDLANVENRLTNIRHLYMTVRSRSILKTESLHF